MRNILCKLPRGAIREIKGLVQQVFLAPDDETARRRGRLLIVRLRQIQDEVHLGDGMFAIGESA